MGVDVPEFVVRLLISSYSRALTRLSERIPAWRINNLRGALNERVRVMFNGRARDRASDPSKTCLIKKEKSRKKSRCIELFEDVADRSVRQTSDDFPFFASRASKMIHTTRTHTHTHTHTHIYVGH